ncbi:hypothetical protein [Brevibacillus sp. BC25]|uniref:hypothetical protein n=1 Tax=Brevibacillus sp. BC25 TaxID=1144308 RepID=UPI000587393B|nr:hypothetical protein [Brevibacillus sp. BC25]
MVALESVSPEVKHINHGHSPITTIFANRNRKHKTKKKIPIDYQHRRGFSLDYPNLNMMSKQIIQEKTTADNRNHHAYDATFHSFGKQPHKSKTEKDSCDQKVSDSNPKNIPRQARKIYVTQT